MAKDKITDYDATAANNLDVGGISVAEGMLPSGVNNAIRELMSHQADAFGAGTPLYVDQTNNRLGIGNAAPATALEVDANGATVATFDRATSDGSIIDLQKDGSTVGSIGNNGGYLHIGSPQGTDAYIGMGSSQVYPATSSGAYRDAAIDLGGDNERFKDLYLSGGVVFGDAGGSGTPSSNSLDSYEEGSWSPAINVGTVSASQPRYTKIGNTVHLRCNLGDISDSTSTEYIEITGLPFAPISTNIASGSSMFRYFNNSNNAQMNAYMGSLSKVYFYWSSLGTNINWTPVTFQNGTQSNMDIIFTITYQTAS